MKFLSTRKKFDVLTKALLIRATTLAEKTEAAVKAHITPRLPVYAAPSRKEPNQA